METNLDKLNRLTTQKYLIQIDDIHKRHGTGIDGKIPEPYYFKIFALGAEARDNADVMLYAFAKCEDHFIGKHTGNFLSNDVEFLKKAVDINPGIYQYGSGTARNNLDLAKHAVAKNSYMYRYVGDGLKESKDLAMFALKAHTQTYKDMSPSLQADKDVMSCAVNKGPLSESESKYLLDAFHAVPRELKSDFGFMKKVASVVHEKHNDFLRFIGDCPECEKFKASFGDTGSVLKSMQSWELMQSLDKKLKPKAQSQTPRMKI